MTMSDGRGAVDFDTAFQLTRTACAHEIDELGHVNNAVYVSWLQDTGVAHWTHMAKGPLLNDHVWVCWRHEVDYRTPVFEGEAVEIRTWLGHCQGAKFDRHVDIRKPNTSKWSVQAKTTWVMLTKTTGKPCRVGQDVFDAFGLDPQHHR